MMLLAAIAKPFVFRWLPSGLLQRARRWHYARKLATAGPEPEMAFLPQFLQAGGTALDLGANFGLYSRFLAEAVGPSGTVHSLEPIPSTFDVLRSNVSRLGLRTVTVHNVAASDQSGTVTMSVPSYERGGENLYEARVCEPATSNSVQVPARRLDDLFAHLPRIDFVKCDVEGHELSVLRGAATILSRHRPAWLIEVSGNPDIPGRSAAQVFELLRTAGYEGFLPDGPTLRPRQFGDRAVNYFFLRPEHVAQMSVDGPA